MTATSEFAEGDKVIYRDRYTALAEFGTVTSTNISFVFVRFGPNDTAQGCDPNQLEHDS